MDGGSVGERPTVQTGLGDFLDLGIRAFLGGIGAALALGFAALLLAHSAEAAPASPNDAKSGVLLLKADDGGFFPAPTVETEVAIQVSGLVARTRLTQSFHNASDRSVEALYVFPLPENAAVDHLWLQVGTRTLEAQVQEKEAARKTYEMAKRDGRKAALLEQQRPNLFTHSVAHIGPNEMVRVTLEYQQALAYDNGTYRLRFPLAVTPRYVPMQAPAEALPDEPKAREAIALSSAEAALGAKGLLMPAYAGGAVVNPVDIAVAIDAGVALGDVASSYHDARIGKRDGNRAVVYLVKDQEEADHDFELTWKLAALAQPQAALFTETVGGTDYALLMVVPPGASAQAAERLPRETILVIDTSGSMQGASLAQAKAALGEALGSLTPQDRFNVVEFNSILRPMWPAPLPVTAQSLESARAWVGKLRADGGTEMAPALRFAFDGTPPAGYLRQVVFMTDGGVGNEDELFKLIVERLGEARLFTVGIGAAPNSHFMTRAAQFGRGTFTCIGDTREVKAKMSALFAKIEAPVLRDVRITWPDGTPLETFPKRVPDLYLGEPVVVSAAATPLAGTLVVSGERGREPWSVALTSSEAHAGRGVGALWARSKIASLMDEVARGTDVAAIRPQVVQVALEHHLVSAYTSLVAVDTTPTAVGAATPARVAASLPRTTDAGMLPQTDTPATLQLLLGVLALVAAAAVALIGTRAPGARLA